MVKTTPAGRIGQQVGVKPRATITPVIQSEIKQAVPRSQPQVDYDRAWKEAKRHWSRGKAGAYLYHMSEGDSDPQVRAVYAYVKELNKQTRIGNISPGRSKGSLLAAEEYRASIAPKPTTAEKPAPLTLPTPPPLEVQPAPTWSEKYSSAIKESGYIKGSLSFLGGTASSLIWRGQEKAVKKYGGKYDPYTAELFGKGVSVAPYFTPYAGPALLIGGGAEEFITPSGRERIGTQAEYFESKGLSPTWAKTGAIALPVVEVALGSFGLMAGKGLFRTWGRKEVPLADFTSAEVIVGTKTFPTAPPKTHLGRFTAEGRGFHATSQPWKELTTTTGKSELPGTYISSEISPYFLRAGAAEGKGASFLDRFYGDIIYGTSKPGVMEIFPAGFRRGEFARVSGVSSKPSGYKWTAPEKYGVAEVPGMKSEIEAILRPGTELQKISGGTFFKYKGKRIPIDQFKVTGAGKKVLGETAGKPVSFYSGRYGGYGYKAPRYKAPSFGVSSYIGRGYKAPTPSYFGVSSGGSIWSPSSGGVSIWSPSSGGVSYGAGVGSGYFRGGVSYGGRGGVSYSRGGFDFGKPGTPTPPIGGWPKFSPYRKVKKTGNSFIPQVMYKGKWKTVGKRMDRNSALSRASRGADLSTSRRMRILPSKKAPQVTSILGWGIRKHKFRPYRKVKGRRVALVNTWIEKTTHAIDTPTEKRGLSIAKLSKQMKWGLPVHKKRKKKAVKQRKK